MKIVVIGGGSTYTPELIDGLIARGAALGLREVWLVDTNSERLRVVSAFAERMVRHAGAQFRIEARTDRRAALPDADFVLTQLRVGGQAARHNDELLGRRHDLIGQETTGVGGFAKALRTVPVMLDIARDIRELAPGARLVNFTNPAGIVTEALVRYGGVPVVGLCNNAITMQRGIARMLRVDPATVRIEQVGLNHLNWVRQITVGGDDATDAVLHAYMQLLQHDEDPIHLPPWVISLLHAIPSGYLEYFYLESQIRERQRSGVPTRAEIVMDVERRLMERYADVHLCEKPAELMERGGAYYSTAAAALIESLWLGDGAEHVVNTRNAGAIPNLPDDVVVELPCRVDLRGATPLAVAPLAAELHGLTSQVKAYELLTIQAAVAGDEAAALKALLANPLGPDVAHVEAVWHDLKRTNAGLLPTFGGQ